MRKFLMKNDRMNDVRGVNVARLLFVALVAVFCAGMCGCDFFGNDDEPVLLDSGFHYDSGFAMVSDTTALVPGHYYNHYEKEYLNYSDDWKECTSEGLLLIGNQSWYGKNYWEGMLDTCYGNTMFSALGDSVVFYWFWMSQNTYKVQDYFVWKVEKEPVRKSAVWISDYVDMNSSSTIMRTWKEGKILFKNYDKFALLDTAANTITQVTKEEAGWPDGVEDAQYFGDDLMTLHFVSENRCGFAILKDVRDTIAVHRENPCGIGASVLAFNGRFVYRMNYDYKSDGDMIFSTDSSWQISEKPVAKYKNGQFQILEE